MALTGRPAQDLSDLDSQGGVPPPGAPPPPQAPWVWGAGHTITWATDCQNPQGEIEVNLNNGQWIQQPQVGPGGLGIVPLCNTSWSIRFAITTQTFGNLPGTPPPHPWTNHYSTTSTQGLATPLPVWLGPSVGAGNEYQISTTGPVASTAEQAIRFTGLYADYYEFEITHCECDGVQGLPPVVNYGVNVQGQANLGYCCFQQYQFPPLFQMIPYSWRQTWFHDQGNWPATTNPPGPQTTQGTMEYYLDGSPYGPYQPFIFNPWTTLGVAPPYLTNIPQGALMENLMAGIDFISVDTLCEWGQDWRVNGAVPNSFDNRVTQFKVDASGMLVTGQPTWFGAFPPITQLEAEKMCDCCDLRTDPGQSAYHIPPEANWVQ